MPLSSGRCGFLLFIFAFLFKTGRFPCESAEKAIVRRKVGSLFSAKFPKLRAEPLRVPVPVSKKRPPTKPRRSQKMKPLTKPPGTKPKRYERNRFRKRFLPGLQKDCKMVCHNFRRSHRPAVIDLKSVCCVQVCTTGQISKSLHLPKG